MPSSDQFFTPDQSKCCPISGLPVTAKPEWTEIQLKPDYSVTFSIIGKAILLITPKGYPSEEGAKALLEKRAEIIKEVGLADRDYVEIRDYSMLSGAPPKGGRMALTNFVMKEGSEGHLKGFLVFGAPLLIRLMFQAGLRVFKTPIPVGVAKDYKEVIREALKVLRQNGVDVGSKLYPRIKKEGWALELDEYGISFELIGDDILYTIAHGKLKESHVEQFMGLHEKVLHEACLAEKGYYYRIINWERFERSTWKARRMYIEGLRAINKKTPCRLLVGFGLNTFMRTLVEISRPFVSSPIMAAKDLEDALEIIDRERTQETGAGSGEKRQKPEAKIYTEEQVKRFANEALQVVGGINWDQAGISLEDMSEDHPLKGLLDALTIVKLDLDDLHEEKEKSQKSLQESEGKYRKILESMNDGYFEIDLKGDLTFCNSILPKLLGYTEEEISGMNYRSYMDSENAETVTEIFRKAFKEDISAKVISYEVTKKDGLKMPIETSFSLMKNAAGKPVGFRGIARDITERKRAEEALRESEERYRTLVENASDMVFGTDENGYFTFINPAVLRITGYEKEEIIGKHYKMLVRPDMFKEAITFFANQLIKKIHNTYYEYPIITKDGHELWFGQNMQLIMENDRVTGFQAVARDITDRKRAEETLRESEEKYRRLADNMQDLVMEVDTMGIIQYISPSSRYLGYEPGEMIGQSCFNLLHPEDKDMMVGLFAEALANPLCTPSLPPYRFVTKSGAIIWIEGYGTSLFDEDQQLIGGLIVGRDITDRKRAEEKLQESEEKYRNILESIEDGYFEVDLAGNFTFFNPSMSTIIGFPRGNAGHEQQGIYGPRKCQEDLSGF